MQNLYKTVLLVIFLSVVHHVQAQITINGYNPRRYVVSNGLNALSVSYGYIIWVDGNNVAVPGYSSSRAAFYSPLNSQYSIEKGNISTGINIGYERKLTNRFAVKGAFSTAKLYTGTSTRFDLETIDKSKFTQFGIYAKYTLTKNEEHRVQFQWLIGPELVYARKDVFIQDYMSDENSEPQTYRQNVSVLEGAMVTGLGLSIRLTQSIALLSEGMIGVSLPGTGLKTTNSLLGVRYSW